MGSFGIKPTRSATGSLVACQTIAITSSSASSWAAFNSSTMVCAVQFRGDVYATFDGHTTPSVSAGFQLYGTKSFHWDVNTAQAAKMIGVSGTVTASLQEFQIYPGNTTLPDTSVVKSQTGT